MTATAAQSHPQRARRARLDRELSRRPGLEARRAMAHRSARAGEPAVGPGRPRDRSCRGRNGRRSASRSPTDGRCPTTICPLRCCCRWDGWGRPFWSTRISRSICSGTTRWSIRPRPPISRPASPARRRCIAARRRRRLPSTRSRTLQDLLVRAGYDVGNDRRIPGPENAGKRSRRCR